MGGWKDRFTFRERFFVEHEVGPNTMRFYPNRVGLLHELAEVSKPLAKAITALLAPDERAGFSEKVSQQGETIIKETSVPAASAEVLDQRARERDGAIEALVGAIANPRNRLLVGRLLMDSLREEFTYSSERSAAEVEEFLYGSKDGYDGLDLPTLGQLIAGWMRANARVFGPAGEALAARAGERLGGARAAPAPRSEFPSEIPSPVPG